MSRHPRKLEIRAVRLCTYELCAQLLWCGLYARKDSKRKEKRVVIFIYVETS